MGKNRKQASLTNVVQYDSNFNLSIGSSTSSSFNSSGSIIAASGFTGSLSGSVFGLGNTVSFSSSVSSDLVNLESKSASVDISITNINSVTASNIARLSNLESKSSSVDISVSSLNTFSASNANQSLNQLTGSLATTGSNTFYGTQVFSGSVFIATDLIVQGSSSIQYISASSVSIGTNIVNLNTATPSVRYAGISVQDSGSSAGITGSMLWDSLCNRWIYSNPSTIGYSGGLLMSGPRASTLGSEITLTCNYIAKSGGGDHLYDSCIIDDGTTTCIKNNLVGTGTISGTTIYGSTVVCSPVGKFTSCIDAGSGNFSGNIGITVANTPEVLLTHSNTSKTFLMAVDGSNAFFRANSTNNILFQYAGGTTALTINGSTGAATFCNSLGVSGATSTNGVLEVLKASSSIAQFSLGWNASNHTDMYVDATGNFYIQPQGTTRLTIASTGASTFACTIQANGGNITSFSSVGAAAFGNGINIHTQPGTYTAGHGGILQFQNEDVITGGIRAIRDGGSWGGALLFYTHNTSAGNTFDTTFVERMRITSDGNVLIGTGTTPEGPLDVYKSNSAGLGGHILLRNNGAAVGNETAVLFVDGGVGSTRAAISSTTEGAPYFGDLKFKTGASAYASLNTRMTITGAGVACFSSTVCAPIITSNASTQNITGIALLTTLETANALYIITVQPEAGSGTSAAALITSRTNQSPSIQPIVASSSLSFIASGQNICLCSNLGYALTTRWGIIRLA